LSAYWAVAETAYWILEKSLTNRPQHPFVELESAIRVCSKLI